MTTQPTPRYSSEIRVPLKSKRQLEWEREDRELYRVLRFDHQVSNRIKNVLKDASKCIDQCNSQIQNIVDFLGESDYPKLKEARVKVFGYSQLEL